MPSLPAFAGLTDSLFHISFLFLTATLTAIIICLENSFWHTQQGSTLEDGFQKAWNSYLAMEMDKHFISQWPNDQFTIKSFQSEADLTKFVNVILANRLGMSYHPLSQIHSLQITSPS